MNSTMCSKRVYADIPAHIEHQELDQFVRAMIRHAFVRHAFAPSDSDSDRSSSDSNESDSDEQDADADTPELSPPIQASAEERVARARAILQLIQRQQDGARIPTALVEQEAQAYLAFSGSRRAVGVVATAAPCDQHFNDMCVPNQTTFHIQADRESRRKLAPLCCGCPRAATYAIVGCRLITSCRSTTATRTPSSNSTRVRPCN